MNDDVDEVGDDDENKKSWKSERIIQFAIGNGVGWVVIGIMESETKNNHFIASLIRSERERERDRELKWKTEKVAVMQFT